jgi:hypothetical protein
MRWRNWGSTWTAAVILGFGIALCFISFSGERETSVTQASGSVFSRENAQVNASTSGRGKRRTSGQSDQIEATWNALRAASPVTRGQLRNDTVIELLRRLAELDPQAAIEFATQHPELHGQADLAAELFAGWQDRDKGSALDWLSALPPGSLRVQLLPLVVSDLASEHPEEAIALAGELPGYDGELDMLAAFGPWNESDEVEGQVRERAYASIFREWASHDPQAAATRANGLEDPLSRTLRFAPCSRHFSLVIIRGVVIRRAFLFPVRSPADERSGLQASGWNMTVTS